MSIDQLKLVIGVVSPEIRRFRQRLTFAEQMLARSQNRRLTVTAQKKIQNGLLRQNRRIARGLPV